MKEQFLLQRAQNYWQTIFLFVGMLALMLGLGFSFFGIEGLVWAAIVGGVGLYMSTRIPTRVIMRMQGGRALRDYEVPELINITRKLARRAELSHVPQLYYVPSNIMNAFTTGSKQDAGIAITRGLLEQLDIRELTGVIAHEMAHIRNNDIRWKGLANVMN